MSTDLEEAANPENTAKANSTANSRNTANSTDVESAAMAIKFVNVSKSYGALKANDKINLEVQKGTIHGIVGENGAGKSTAMKLLFGLETPDSGEIYLHQKLVHFKNPVQAIQHGIGMVHQHFMLSDEHSGLDNVLLHQSAAKSQNLFKNLFSLLQRQHFLKSLTFIQQKYDFKFDLLKKVKDLTVGEQQQLEILKILSQKSHIIILDEPTAVLTPQETKHLFKNLKILKEAGHTILIITHKLKEIQEITDEVTVFRQGRVVAEFKTRDVTFNMLAEAMVGRPLMQPPQRTQTKKQDKVLQIKDLNFSKNSKKLLDQLNFDVHRGEIVGLAGVEGNGQNELIMALWEPLQLKNKKNLLTGEITFYDKSEPQDKVYNLLNLTTEQIRQLPLALMPEDRLKVGVLPTQNLQENLILGHHHDAKYLNAVGIYQENKIQRATKEAIEKFDIRPASTKAVFSGLSGGNQQKLVVARELNRPVQFILASHPTRGVDIGAIERIHQQITTVCSSDADNCGALLISSELEELLALSDRILVIYNGQIRGEFLRAQWQNPEDQQSLVLQIGSLMGGRES